MQTCNQYINCVAISFTFVHVKPLKPAVVLYFQHILVLNGVISGS